MGEDAGLGVYDEYINENGKFLIRMFAQRMTERYNFITMEDTEEIYVFKKGYYQPKGESFIREITESFIPDRVCRVSRTKTEVIGAIRDRTRMEREHFSEPPRFINLDNGVYNLESDEFMENASEGYCFRHKLPVKYDSDAEPDKILPVIKEMVHNEDMQVVQELFGYLMYRAYPIQKAIMLLGEGENGKSTFLKIIERFIGSDNIASPALQTLLENRFSRIELQGKLANINGDLDPDTLSKTGIFKKLTGEDAVRAEKKHVQESIKFKNYAKLVYASNELPRTKDISPAFFRRWVILEFPYKFTSKNDEHKDKVDGIIDKVVTDKQLSGLFNWALEGLKRLLDNGDFTKTPSTTKVKERWLVKADTLHAFLESCTEPNHDVVVTKESFMDVYQKFCDAYDVVPQSKAKVGRRIGELASVSNVQRTIKNSRKRVWKGIEFTNLDFDTSNFDIEMYDDNVSGDLYKNGGFINYTVEKVFEEEGLRQELKDVFSKGETLSIQELCERFSDEYTVREIVSEVERAKEEGEIMEVEKGVYKKPVG